MGSVATDIRINLLANLAGFSGAMKDAGDTADKTTARFNKAFDASKAVSQRAAKEAGAWRDAMQKEGSFLASNQSFSAGPTNSHAALDKNIPWGDGYRTELSRQAAETAATLGREGTKLNGILGSALKLGGKIPGLGEGIDLGVSLMENPATALGGAAFATHEYASQKSDEMRGRARSAMHTGAVLGTDVETASRLNAVGFDEELGSRFQRSLHDDSPGFKDIGLDSKKLSTESFTQALEEVGDALKHVNNPADRAAAAMEIFGRSGAEVLPILTGLKTKLDDVAESALVTSKAAEKTRTFDNAKRETDRVWNDAEEKVARGVGADEGFGTSWEKTKGRLIAGFSGHGIEGMDEYDARVSRGEDRAYHASMADQFKRTTYEKGSFGWQMEEDAKRAADRKKAEELRKKNAEEGAAAMNASELDVGTPLANAMGADAWGNQADESRHRAIRENGTKQGWGGEKIQREIDGQDAIAQQGREAGQGWSLAKSGQTAFDRDRQNQEAIDSWKAHVAPGRKDTDLQLARMKYSADKSYGNELGIKNPEEEYAQKLADLAGAKGRFSADKLHRAAADAADALMNGLDKPFATAFERFESHMAQIDKGEKDHSYTPEEAERRRKAETEGELAHAGIKRPLDDFKKSFEELNKLHDARDKDGNPLISDAEFNKRTGELRRSAVSEETADVHTISPVAAMQAGSKEAYSALVNAQLNLPKEEIAKETNKKLDKIVENTKPRAAQRGKVLN